ncbi:flagellar motor switch phosphatase FliY [Clostridium sp. 19966]|uniref:flagellar motor switch phosphatase FliY n=1 Tax=Clostridium sp. 19966 TaxID=2768166 RepID=UPI0028DFC18E|nr:flagellar motor switch phosphatase FliY [Clostridium sp. 19966]MDT8716676.1 flagellar motor switch phosphatase FliY [Clostridium sp. 19966]
MSNGFLSQEEIDSLLNGGAAASTPDTAEPQQEEILSDIEKDLLGEVGNISMGSASTALSQILNQPVNITTPVVTLTTFDELTDTFEVPNIAVAVEYVTGIIGKNLLVMKSQDAAVIASLMMGGDGKVQVAELTEIEESAVSEAMNQMIGSAATSMATMFAREVNISPPNAMIWHKNDEINVEDMDPKETIVKVSFRLTIGDLVDSNIMQILPVTTAKKIVSIMMGKEEQETKETVEVKAAPSSKNIASEQPKEIETRNENNYYYEEEQPQRKPSVEVHRADFQPLESRQVYSQPKNIDLIMDVPLDISVVLGRTKKSIKDILALGTGSLIELDKLAEEPVEILVNGKRVAYGEVVVVDENFGVRITSIVNSEERIKSLGK